LGLGERALGGERGIAARPEAKTRLHSTPSESSSNSRKTEGGSHTKKEKKVVPHSPWTHSGRGEGGVIFLETTLSREKVYCRACRHRNHQQGGPAHTIPPARKKGERAAWRCHFAILAAWGGARHAEHLAIERRGEKEKIFICQKRAAYPSEASAQKGSRMNPKNLKEEDTRRKKKGSNLTASSLDLSTIKKNGGLRKPGAAASVRRGREKRRRTLISNTCTGRAGDDIEKIETGEIWRKVLLILKGFGLFRIVGKGKK